MRNPKRIDEFLERLGKVWKQVPDWRFGQLMVNVFGTMSRDPFFPEDDEMIEYFENYFKKIGLRRKKDDKRRKNNETSTRTL